MESDAKSPTQISRYVRQACSYVINLYWHEASGGNFFFSEQHIRQLADIWPSVRNWQQQSSVRKKNRKLHRLKKKQKQTMKVFHIVGYPRF